MTTEAVFNFSESELLGTVAAVDTARVGIAVHSATALSYVAIGNLVAIKGATETELLIGLVERVTRGLSESLVEPRPDAAEIPIAVSPVDTVRVALIGTYRAVQGARKHVFKRGADSFPQIDRSCHLIVGGNLQRFMGLLGAGLAEEEKLRLGTFVADRSAAAIASGDKLFQRHAAILGSTGAGKSWAVALILERASKLTHPNIIVFDLHGEYAPLGEESSGFATRFKIAGPGDLTTPGKNVVFLPYWALNRDELLSMLLDRSDQNAPNQASRFTLHVRELKGLALDAAIAGGSDTAKAVKATYTVDSPIPFNLSELLTRLRDDDTQKGIGVGGKPVKGEWEGKLTRFISRLEAKTGDRRYGFMFNPPAEAKNYNWLQEFAVAFFESDGKHGMSGIKVLDFSEVPSDVLPVVTGVFARLLYDIQFWMHPSSRSPISLFCDEAHLYLPTREDADAVERQALWNFERIAKEGRKYGFGLVVISQRPSDVSRTILSQCNNFIALRLTNESDQSVVKKLVPDALAQLTEALPLMDVGEALILGDAMLLPTRIKLDQPTIEPASATRDFWREWNEDPPDLKAVRNAVEALRAQARS